MTLVGSEGFVVFLDIYGYKALLAENIKNLVKNISDSFCIAKKYLSERNVVPKIYALSDSIFLFYPGCENNAILCQRCIEDIKEILGIFVSKKIALRGAVAYGHVVYDDNFLIGESVIRAVEYEKLVQAPLVIIPQREIVSIFNPSCEFIINHFSNIKLKENKTISGKIIIPFPVEEYIDLIQSKTNEYLIHGPYEVATAWLEASHYVSAERDKWKI